MEVDINDKSNTNVLNVDTLLVNEKNEDPKASDIDSNESSTEEESSTFSFESLVAPSKTVVCFCIKIKNFIPEFKYYSYLLNSKRTQKWLFKSNFPKVTFQK